MKRIVLAEHVPVPASPYSQIVETGNLVFLSGQTGEDWSTGRIVAGGLTAECRRMLDNVGALLRAAGLGYPDVVQVTLYVVDIETMPVLNTVYREYFAPEFPARSTVEVSKLGIGAHVEMAVVASR